MKLRALSGALAATALLLSTTASAATSPTAALEPTTEIVEGSELDSVSGLSPAILIVGAIAIGLIIYFAFIDDDDEEPTSP